VKIGFIPPAAEIGHPARDTGFLLARLDELWPRAPHYKPLSVGVVLFDLVPAVLHQPDLFAADTHRRQKLSPLIDRINDRYGRCAIGFGLLPPEVRAFKGMRRFTRCRRAGSFEAHLCIVPHPISRDARANH
jgi:hypothetical protein